MKTLTMSLLTGLLLCSVYTTSARADAFDAKAVYEAKCAKCHGKTGNGDGKSAKSLNTKPTEFSSKKVFSEKKKGSDLEALPRMAKAIKEGGLKVGQSKEMDGFPDYTDEQVQALLTYIQTLAK